PTLSSASTAGLATSGPARTSATCAGAWSGRGPFRSSEAPGGCGRAGFSSPSVSVGGGARAGRGGVSRRGAAAAAAVPPVGGGGAAGVVGGTALWRGRGSQANATVPAVMGVLGTAVGGLGAAGVGAGLAAAEAVVRSWRRLSLGLLGALGGGAVGALAHLIGQWTVQGPFGRAPPPVARGFH